MLLTYADVCRRKPAAQQLLEALLRGVLMRHSKSQTYADGRSILDLPASSTRRVAIAQVYSLNSALIDP
jgi:hypothetical protein